jgi:hypothetical protein
MIGKMKTPETDALYERLLAENPGNLIYLEEMLELACRLERERDEAVRQLENIKASSIHTCHDQCQRPMCILRRERDEAIFSKNTSAADFLKQIGQITLCKDVAREKLLMAEKERDETRKQFVDFLNKTEDYKRERDEAIRQRNETNESSKYAVDYAMRERDEAREKYDNEATEHMLAVNKLCNERDQAIKVADELKRLKKSNQ